MKFGVFLIVLFAVAFALAQPARVTSTVSPVNSSFRALSVVDNRVAWVAGSNGHVGRTEDGGNTWTFNQVKDFEELDLRSLYAFDHSRAIIANAGSPAYILATRNGGQTWEVVYANSHANAFLDGVDFWNDNEGLIYGDPIDGRMLLLRTIDGGNSWSVVEQAPLLAQGEASFAASGTGIRCVKPNQVVITTGGTMSRVWRSADKGSTWTSISVPVIQGESSTGVFSIGMLQNNWVVVGGDYLQPSKADRHIFYSADGGATWHVPATGTRGYRECVEPAGNGMWLAAGPTGVEFSADDGKTWRPLSDETGFHTVRKARTGSLILLAGSRKLGYVRIKTN
ncbi:YCF48-related protein [Oscillatoria amoena NRMC-F 0135]|nr:YCF48-related protein [Oscillatoria amoena NRMC-F 0135]